MKIRHPALIRGVGVAGSIAIRRLMRTNDFRFRFEDPSISPEVGPLTGRRYIYSLFHEVLLFGVYFWARPDMNVMISDHRDGEMITQVVKRMGFGVVRGSSTRGGFKATREMIRRGDIGNLCITPDGPKGPRRQVQPGLIYLASRTGMPIVCLGLAFKNPWRASSWDRFAVPRPFMPAACVCHKSIVVPEDADRDMLEHYREVVQRQMLLSTEEAEAWVEKL